MKHLLILLFLIPIQIFAAEDSFQVKEAHIQWDEEMYVNLDKKLFTTSEGLWVFGSFRLHDEDFRKINLRRAERFEIQEFILVRKEYTVFILDLRTEKKVGQFNIPSRGSPKYIEVKPDKEGMTTLKVSFRMLPSTGKGRPGPLIEEVFIYVNGKYQLKKRAG